MLSIVSWIGAQISCNTLRCEQTYVEHIVDILEFIKGLRIY